MTTQEIPLPISETVEPMDQQELVDAVAGAFAEESAIYPIGGGTSLDFGLPAKVDGIGLSLAKLNKVIDYPARDMTVTVEAGVTMQTLAETLAAEGQQLPIDVPNAATATIGGVVATNFNGPRRFGLGTIRDYVIGISAVDGTGRLFKGGGRVVKNVAGYDFCKLLTGSLGSLGVISQITLKLKPIPASSVLMTCRVGGLNEAEKLLAALGNSRITPAAIELLTGPTWQNDPAWGGASTDDAVLHLVVGLEGTEPEVHWMIDQLGNEWRDRKAKAVQTLTGDAAAALWTRLKEFPQAGEESPLVIQASVVPSGTAPIIAAVRDVDPAASIQAHAGNGVVIARFSEFPEDGLSRTLLAKLQPAATAHHGNIIVLSNPGGAEMTHQSVWGGIDAPFDLMTEVKKKFDPKNLLNPGRFVYL